MILVDSLEVLKHCYLNFQKLLSSLGVPLKWRKGFDIGSSNFKFGEAALTYFFSFGILKPSLSFLFFVILMTADWVSILIQDSSCHFPSNQEESVSISSEAFTLSIKISIVCFGCIERSNLLISKL